MSTDRTLVFSENAEVLSELLTAAKSVIGSDGCVIAVCIGSRASETAEESLERGAQEALIVPAAIDSPSGAEEILAQALCEIAQAEQPGTILTGATRIGNDVASRLAQALCVPCTTNCVALKRVDDGSLEIQRRVFGGRFLATQVLSGAPQIASVAPSRFAKAELVERCGVIREIDLTLPESRVRMKATQPRERSSVDVSKAQVIVAAGRGVKKLEDLALLDSLAGALGGVLAGSRPLTGDVDWLPTDRRIGLSGKTVKPNLYLACGISGQIEHVVGIKGARTVVAINSDPKAPIHEEADYSVIGDLYEVVPAVLEALKKG